MRPQVLNFLFSDTSVLPGVGEKTARALRNLAGPHVVDLLWHLPTGVNHRPFWSDISGAQTGEMITFEMRVTQHIAPKIKRLPYRVMGLAGDTLVELVFFNYHASYLTDSLPLDVVRVVSGKCERTPAGAIKVMHPDYIAPTRDKVPEYEAVYPLQAGISGKTVRRVIESALSGVPDLPEWLDGPFKRKMNFASWQESIRRVHNPKNLNEVLPNSIDRKRVAYDEMLANQLALFLMRAKMKRERGFNIVGDGRLQERLKASLPFELTKAQNRAMVEIKKDMAGASKMIRLLQGDVGSGKTIVAVMAFLNAIEAGYQGVFMAPTDILARQHLVSLKRYLDPLNVRVEVLTGREKGKKRAELIDDLTSNKINILIGTHAVFVEDVIYHKLGLIVIDEQHRFGVEQRLSLTRKEPMADLMVMSATPIPRSLALTVYGDMDISILDEKPAGRQPIETRVLSMKKIPELVAKLKELTTKSGERTQAYWVCPLVEESEKSDLMAAEKRYAELQGVFGGRAGLVHGRMKDVEKDAVMKKFIDGEIDILVATTVIEVGVDVKTASIMVVEHAERFGLSALHQLRGRVGRGNAKSACLLLHGSNLGEKAIDRLNIMRKTDDGFLIAEEDLRLRGAGELLGRQQSGMGAFRLADLAWHGDMLAVARDDARMMLTLDPDLKTPRGQALRILLYLFQKNEMVKTVKSG